MALLAPRTDGKLSVLSSPPQPEVSHAKPATRGERERDHALYVLVLEVCGSSSVQRRGSNKFVRERHGGIRLRRAI